MRTAHPRYITKTTRLWLCCRQ